MTAWDAARLRQRTLAAWSADPATIARDAAAEAELAHVSHAGRVVVELLQNAADAASNITAEGGDLARVRVTYQPHDDGCATLRVSNTGSAVDAAGLAAMASLRGSTKSRHGDADNVAGGQGLAQVGRFGVGFAAVAGVSDHCQVSGQRQAVIFDRAQARDAVDSAGLRLSGDTAEGTSHAVPMLRLPFDAHPEAEEGFVTTVEVKVRQNAAHAVQTAVRDIDDWCLIALPTIEHLEVIMEDSSRVIRDVSQRWIIQRATGSLSDGARASLPGVRGVDSRFAVAAAIAKDADTWARQSVRGTLLAPTPTDVPMDWPMLCVAGVPVDEARRRVLPGIATDEVVAVLAHIAAETIERYVADGGRALACVPTKFARSAVDAAARAKLIMTLADRPILCADDRLVSPQQACMLAEPELAGDDEWVRWLATSVPGLVTIPFAERAAAIALSVATVEIGSALEGFVWPASERLGWTWQDFAAAVAARLTKPGVRGALGAMLVPTERADGGERLAPANSGVALASGLTEQVRLALVAAGVKFVRADIAADPHAATMMSAAGAKVLRAEDALWCSQLQAWAEQPTDDDDDADVRGEALLQMVADALAAGGTDEIFADAQTYAAKTVSVDRFHWLRETQFRGVSGDLCEAWTLVAPSSPLAAWVSDEAAEPVDTELFSRFPAEVWRTFGVLDTITTLDLTGVSTDDLAQWEWLDGGDEWFEEVGPGTLMDGSLIAGVELIAPEFVGEALRVIDDTPQLREALTSGVRVAGPNGEFTAPSPTAWWLSRDLGCAGVGAGELADWFGDTIPELQGISGDVAAALGAATTFEALTADGWQSLFDALEDEPDVKAWHVHDFWAALTHAAPTLLASTSVVEPPSVLPMAVGGQVLWCDPREVWVAADEFWRARRDLGEIVVVPRGTAEAAAAMGVGLVTDADAGAVTSQGTPREVPASLRGLARSVPESIVVHKKLLVDEVEVPWWVDADGAAHADERHMGVALAYASDAWGLREEFRDLLVTEVGRQQTG